jgi:hypothetical protein
MVQRSRQGRASGAQQLRDAMAMREEERKLDDSGLGGGVVWESRETTTDR